MQARLRIGSGGDATNALAIMPRWSAVEQRRAVDHLAYSAHADFSGIALLPSIAAGPARALLASQGYNPAIIGTDGALDVMNLLASAFDKVEISTSLYAHAIDLLAPSDPAATAKVSRALRYLKPAITFRGRAGTVTLAPYGKAAAPSLALPLLILGGAAVGLMFFGKALL
jgi:hypothetical protein